MAMVTPGQLVKAVSQALRTPEATVILHDRLLAEHGHRRSGGRGRSAVHMLPEDAIALLIAVAAPPITGPAVRETIQTYRHYASLKAHVSPEFDVLEEDRPGKWDDLKILQDLEEGHTLAAALTELLRVFMADGFEDLSQVWKQPASGPVKLFVTFYSAGAPSATIRVQGKSEEGDPCTTELLYLTAQADSSKLRGSDFIQSSSFGELTMKMIAKLLVENSASPSSGSA
jgi:hypothetical protein